MLPKTSVVRALVVLVVAGLGAATSRAQSTGADRSSVTVSLESVIDSVLTRNPTLKAHRLSGQIHLERVSEATLLDPRLTVGYYPVPIFTARGAQRWMARADLEIPFPGKIDLDKRLARSEAIASDLASTELEIRLVFEAKRAYYQLYRIDRQLDLAADFQDRLRLFEEAATSRYKVGLGSQQEILKAQLERVGLDATIAALQADRRTAEKTLARLQDMEQSQPLEPDGLPVLQAPPDVPLALIADTAVARRPEIALIDALAESKKVEMAIARKDWLPNLGLFASYVGISDEPIPSGADGRDALFVGASVRIPLFAGNRNVGYSTAQLEADQLQFDRTAVETRVRNDVEDLVSRIERESEQMRLLREFLIPQAQTTVEVALSDYTTGRAGFLDLLDAERTLFSLRNQLEEAIERYAAAIAELERTVGTPIADLADANPDKK